MKVDWNKKYTTIAVYGFIVVALSIIFYSILSEVNLFKIQMSKYSSALQPITIGFAMAYLFNFILEFIEAHLLNFKLLNNSKGKFKRMIGLLLTYTVIFLLLYLFLNFIFPQLVSSITGLVSNIDIYVTNISNFIEEISDKYYINEEYYDLFIEKWNEFVNNIVQFATNLIPILGNIVKGVFSSIWNIVLGVVVSTYLLIDKEKFIAIGRKVTTSIFSEKTASRIIELTKRADSIFGRFLSGKILDSLIIGILTFVVLRITKMPYTTLVAFIIGVTNIIPFFGPFIGAVPSFFIILFVSPIKALWFLLIVVIIQQIDGNIIGPKILGDSLGISAFWILFSLLVAGKIFGFIGLIIGVPLFVFVYSIIKDVVEERLKNRGLPVNTDEYL